MIEREGENECCKTCGNQFEIVRFDYYGGGCAHTRPEGYVCMAFADERQAIWMTGIQDDGSGDMCECYIPRKKQNQQEGIDHDDSENACGEG